MIAGARSCPERSTHVEGHSHSAGTKPDAWTSTTTSLIAGFGSGRSASVIPAASAAWSVATTAFIGASAYLFLGLGFLAHYCLRACRGRCCGAGRAMEVRYASLDSATWHGGGARGAGAGHECGGMRRVRGRPDTPRTSYRPYRGDLRGEPQLRQPVRRLGRRRRAARRAAAAAGRAGRHATGLSAAERRQPDLAATSGALYRNGRRTAGQLGVPQPAVPDRRLHRAAGLDLSRAGPVRAQRDPEGAGPARWLHARPRAPLLPGAVPDQRRADEPLRRRQRR